MSVSLNDRSLTSLAPNECDFNRSCAIKNCSEVEATSVSEDHNLLSEAALRNLPGHNGDTNEIDLVVPQSETPERRMDLRSDAS